MWMMEIDETRGIVNFKMYNGFNGSRLQHLFNLYHKMTIMSICISMYIYRHIYCETIFCLQDGVLDTSDDFYDFRCRVSELIKDVIFIVGSSTCFSHVSKNKVWIIKFMCTKV